MPPREETFRVGGIALKTTDRWLLVGVLAIALLHGSFWALLLPP